MYSCVKHDVPFVLTGSIRDDGPLPEVIGNAYEGQTAMRNMVKKSTTVICLATMLHTIATGNMTPSYRVLEDGTVRPVFLYTVDADEFVVNKLLDRGKSCRDNNCHKCTGLYYDRCQGAWTFIIFDQSFLSNKKRMTGSVPPTADQIRSVRFFLFPCHSA